LNSQRSEAFNILVRLHQHQYMYKCVFNSFLSFIPQHQYIQMHLQQFLIIYPTTYKSETNPALPLGDNAIIKKLRLFLTKMAKRNYSFVCMFL